MFPWRLVPLPAPSSDQCKSDSSHQQSDAGSEEDWVHPVHLVGYLNSLLGGVQIMF
jgi:hypothetical protein